MDVADRQATKVRSRRGCLTCRSKKVKCDEQRSNCGRCRRLALKCEWDMHGNSRLKGKTKSKLKAKAALPKILPNYHVVNPCVQDSGYGSDVSIGTPLGCADPPLQRCVARDGDIDLSSFSAEDGTNSMTPWDNWYQELGFSADFLDIGAFAAEGGLDEPPSNASAESILLPQQPLTPVRWMSNLTSPLNILSPNTCAHNIVLLSSFSQTGKEGQALHHYRTYFPTVTVTKNVSWSTHMVMLRHGSQNPMIMHLLIAASLMNLAACQDYDDNICSAAREHSRAGFHLLKDAMDSGTEADHMDILTAFFFFYKYTEKQKHTDPRSVTELSQALCNHVKLNGLVAMCTDFQPSSPSSKVVATQSVITRCKREYLARMIIWLFYEDASVGVKGYGGVLARYLCAEPERSSEIYQQSTTSLESAWGSDYPECEIIDDIENGPILKFLYDVMTLYTEVNDASRSSHPSTADVDAVESKIRRLEERSRFLLRLTTITTQSQSRIMINADYMVAFFYALRIYKFRCFQQDATITPPEVQASVNSILCIAQRSFSSQQLDIMVERFQWPLFMAGIETSDNIHKEWIQTKLRKVKLSDAFRRIVEMQDRTRMRVSMPVARQIMCGKGPQPALQKPWFSALGDVDNAVYSGQMVSN